MSKDPFERIHGNPDETIKLHGKWFVELRGPDGKMKDYREGTNVVCTNGKEFLASFLYSAAVAASTFTCKYVAIGTDSTAEAAAQTALGTEVSRHTGTVSYVSNQIFQVKATFATGSGTGAIVEYGLFSSNTGGTMLSRDTESVINKGANDTLTATLQLTLS
jgi:hypothetical protein